MINIMIEKMQWNGWMIPKFDRFPYDHWVPSRCWSLPALRAVRSRWRGCGRGKWGRRGSWNGCSVPIRKDRILASANGCRCRRCWWNLRCGCDCAATCDPHLWPNARRRSGCPIFAWNRLSWRRLSAPIAPIGWPVIGRPWWMDTARNPKDFRSECGCCCADRRQRRPPEELRRRPPAMKRFRPGHQNPSTSLPPTPNWNLSSADALSVDSSSHLINWNKW